MTPALSAWRRWAPSLAVTLSIVTAHAGAQTVTTDSTAKRLTRGRELFEGRGLCLTCHGKEGQGIKGLGPALGMPFMHTKGTVAELVALITAGVDSAQSKSGVVMPPKGGSRLSPQDVEMVAEYVLTFRKDRPNL